MLYEYIHAFTQITSTYTIDYRRFYTTALTDFKITKSLILHHSILSCDSSFSRLCTIESSLLLSYPYSRVERALKSEVSTARVHILPLPAALQNWCLLYTTPCLIIGALVYCIEISHSNGIVACASTAYSTSIYTHSIRSNCWTQITVGRPSRKEAVLVIVMACLSSDSSRWTVTS